MKDITFEIYSPFSQFDRVKDIWTAMLMKCPHTYFLSWPWTETWIKSLSPDCNLSLVAGLKNETPVVAFFLGSKTTTRHRFFKFHQLSLNQTLIPHIDVATYIEYNAVLIDPGIVISLESLLESLPIKSWDEFRMIRCSTAHQPNLIIDDGLNKKYIVSREPIESYFVNLDKVRSLNNDYLALLSQKRRNKLRRSLKEYKKTGEIKIAIAGNEDDAQRILDELIELHQKRWTERGDAGAFSNQYFLDFHKKLIHDRLKHGEIQLMKVSAGDYTIGCLSSFIYQGEVIGSLCGFNYVPDNIRSPGLTCHYMAIEHNTRAGYKCYDLLDGEEVYKKSLSTDCHEMESIVVTKKGLKHAAERLMVKLHQVTHQSKDSIPGDKRAHGPDPF